MTRLLISEDGLCDCTTSPTSNDKTFKASKPLLYERAYLFGARVLALVQWLKLPNDLAMIFRGVIRDAEFLNYLRRLKFVLHVK